MIPVTSLLVSHVHIIVVRSSFGPAQEMKKQVEDLVTVAYQVLDEKDAAAATAAAEAGAKSAAEALQMLDSAAPNIKETILAGTSPKSSYSAN